MSIVDGVVVVVVVEGVVVAVVVEGMAVVVVVEGVVVAVVVVVGHPPAKMLASGIQKSSACEISVTPPLESSLCGIWLYFVFLRGGEFWTDTHSNYHLLNANQ